MKNVVVVGIGKRSKNVLIPAIMRLPDTYRIFAVLGRSARREIWADYAFDVRTELLHEEWSKVDVLILAVPKEKVGVVLSHVPHTERKRISVLLDTPVIPLRQLGLLRVLAQFKRAFVSEDSVGLPFWESVRAYSDDGTIGTVTKIEFFQSGYRYHALAAAKIATHTAAFWSIRMRKKKRTEAKDSTAERFIHMPHARAYLLEPRNYRTGRTLVTGTNGSVGDYPSDALHYHQVPSTPGDEAMEAAKVEGFVRILGSIDEKQSAYHYAPLDGVYDYLACALSERTGWFFDVPLPGGQSLVKYMLVLLSFVAPR